MDELISERKEAITSVQAKGLGSMESIVVIGKASKRMWPSLRRIFIGSQYWQRTSQMEKHVRKAKRWAELGGWGKTLSKWMWSLKHTVETDRQCIGEKWRHMSEGAWCWDSTQEMMRTHSFCLRGGDITWTAERVSSEFRASQVSLELTLDTDIEPQILTISS